MAADGVQLRQFDELLSRFEKEIIDAFIEAIEDLRSEAEVQKIIRLLEAGDIEGAMQALHLDAGAFQPVNSAGQRAFEAGGRLAATNLPRRNGVTGERIVARFDGSNPRAVEYLREHSARLVTRILLDTRAGLRLRMIAGMERAENPRATGLNIIGRVNRVTGRREGGLIGLTSPQMEAAAAARIELASSDPAMLRAYLQRGRRDKRFDRSVMKAIREGKALPKEIAQKAGDRYADRLLALRGETLARTEALASLHAGSHQALLQAVENGAVRADQLRRTWRSASDGRVRHTHRGLSGDTVGLNEPFTSPSGARLMYPGDTSLGAPGSEVIGCRCVVVARVDWISNLLGRAA